MKQVKINGHILIKKIQAKFSERLFFTCMPFKKNKTPIAPATFGSDNISELDSWLLLMEAKMVSGKVDGIAVVMRVFLDEKVNVVGACIPIPKKNLYHILILNGMVVLFDTEETFDAQNTDGVTGLWLEPEPALTCHSSVELMAEMGVS